MGTLVKADIFFFIATIAVVLVTASVIVLVWYTIAVARKIRQLCETVENDLYTTRSEARELMLRVRESSLFKLLFRNGRKSKK